MRRSRPSPPFDFSGDCQGGCAEGGNVADMLPNSLDHSCWRLSHSPSLVSLSPSSTKDHANERACRMTPIFLSCPYSLTGTLGNYPFSPALRRGKAQSQSNLDPQIFIIPV